MDLCLDKTLFVKTSSSAGYSLPVSFTVLHSGAGKATGKTEFCNTTSQILTKTNHFTCREESGSPHTCECSSFPCVNWSRHQYLKTEQENTLPYMVVMTEGDVLIYTGKIYMMTCKSKIPGFSNLSNKHRNPSLISVNFTPSTC